MGTLDYEVKIFIAKPGTPLPTKHGKKMSKEWRLLGLARVLQTDVHYDNEEPSLYLAPRVRIRSIAKLRFLDFISMSNLIVLPGDGVVVQTPDATLVTRYNPSNGWEWVRSSEWNDLELECRIDDSYFWTIYTIPEPNVIERLKSTGGLFDAVADEAQRAIDRHGFDQTPANPDMNIHEKMTILTEEVGEVARACTYDEGSAQQRIEELTQVATMALMWAEAEKELLDGNVRRG